MEIQLDCDLSQKHQGVSLPSLCSNLLFTCDTCCRFLSVLHDRYIKLVTKGTLLTSQTKTICWTEWLLIVCSVYTHNSKQRSVIDWDQNEYLPACISDEVWKATAFIWHSESTMVLCVHIHWKTCRNCVKNVLSHPICAWDGDQNKHFKSVSVINSKKII